VGPGPRPSGSPLPTTGSTTAVGSTAPVGSVLMASVDVAVMSHGPPLTRTSIEEQGEERRNWTNSVKQSPDQHLRAPAAQRAGRAAARWGGRGGTQPADRRHQDVEVRHGCAHDRTSVPGSGDETSIRPRSQELSRNFSDSEDVLVRSPFGDAGPSPAPPSPGLGDASCWVIGGRCLPQSGTRGSYRLVCRSALRERGSCLPARA